ncbi:hypothetical protein SAY87_006264 [Trapa incisa]|uniref:Nucleotide-diphospho-sugar transferase domain-containing protein n=1 Tax=Trapa incisa TaxID=236973 RepID=A0AAN7PXZ2_9MYRT|nr:hypothetical protein SAY87_006264 [Trapa incisa]
MSNNNGGPVISVDHEGGDEKNCPSAGSGGACRLLNLPLDVRLGLLLAGLAVSCLLLYNSTDTLEYFCASYTSSRDSMGGKTTDDHDLGKVLRAAAMEDGQTVILTNLNEAWAEPGSLLDLFLEAFRVGNGTLELLDHLVLVALDKKAFDRCRAVHRHCFNLPTKEMNFSGEAHFMSAGYLELVWRKIQFLGEVLERGYSFLFTDTDIMWLRSPFPHLYPDADLQFSCDNYRFGPVDRRNRLNSGFTYVRSSNRTVEFFKFWYGSRRSFPGLHDQDALQRIMSGQRVSNMGLQIRFLDTVYFSGFCQLSRDLSRICTVHANCCVGLDNKIRDLSIVLDDWRKYMAAGSGGWSVPKDCMSRDAGSLDFFPTEAVLQERCDDVDILSLLEKGIWCNNMYAHSNHKENFELVFVVPVTLFCSPMSSFDEPLMYLKHISACFLSVVH